MSSVQKYILEYYIIFLESAIKESLRKIINMQIYNNGKHYKNEQVK